MSMIRRIPMDGVMNFRDLGGLCLPRRRDPVEPHLSQRRPGRRHP